MRNEPTKLEMLECVAKVFNDRNYVNAMHAGGVYVPVVRETSHHHDKPYNDTPTNVAYKVYAGYRYGENEQEIHAICCGKRVSMTYSAAMQLARILPEMKWENI